MTYSQVDLATRCMRDLGLLGDDEVLAAPEYDHVIQTVSSEVALLASIDMPIWNGSDMAVPVEYLTALSARIGLTLAPGYGLMSMADAELAKPRAEQNLRKLAQKPGTGSTLQSEYL